MKSFTLKDIADVQMGYSFRSKLEPVANGNTSVIQMKDLNDNEDLKREELLTINTFNIKSHSFIQRGDILFRSRGQTNTSVIIRADLSTALASAPLFVIRVKDANKVSPEFLNWYINQHDSQAFIASHGKSSMSKINMISKNAVENIPLPCPLPPLATQITMAKLALLAEREQKLLSSLSNKRRQLMAAELKNILTNPFA